MNIKPIKIEKDYEKALKRFEKIFDASPKSKEGDEAEILSLLIENLKKCYIYPHQF
ncbi:MAG: transcriptional regulator [Bacteroidetes bacterium]|nr:transcriptional regulator [Bacteroidota bacterium]